MSISENLRLKREIEQLLEKEIPLALGVNKKNEIVRLLYEISRRDGVSPGETIHKADLSSIKQDKGGIYRALKKRLMLLRYPSFFSEKDPRLVPLKILKSHEECPIWDSRIDPGAIFVEKSVKDHAWTRDFLAIFPKAEVKEIASISDSVKSLPGGAGIGRYNTRRERVFLIRNKDAFIKICPCTKGYKRCGYWILNLGFGCPIDCSYCFLQLYSNAPGIVLAANVEDYRRNIEDFDKKINKRIRIGTGEFTDSLALDEYTGYSSALISYFRDLKNLVLELKTKVSGIDRVLRSEPHDNVVISWSMNTPSVADAYEKGGAPVKERIEAACRAAKRGFKIAFHFDPIVYSKEWEDHYRTVVRELFSIDAIRKMTQWISLGTLRYTPGLKQIAEERFADNNIFYDGEFFVDTDGKLRYPGATRADMYGKMVKWIREEGARAWIYLCMEPEEVWKAAGLGRSDYEFKA